jgi:hypothetical protein
MRPPGVVDPVVTVDPGMVLLELRRSVEPVPEMSKLHEQISNFALGKPWYERNRHWMKLGWVTLSST